jgi:hypothetical protein
MMTLAEKHHINTNQKQCKIIIKDTIHFGNTSIAMLLVVRRKERWKSVTEYVWLQNMSEEICAMG